MYKLTSTDEIIRLADGASIPADPRNRDYAKYLKWKEAGGVPEPADIIEPVYSISPQSVLIAAGETLEITVTGAAGDYVLIIEGLAVPEQHITIDETGVEIIKLPAIDAGIYKIKGTRILSQCVAKVEVI